MQLNLFGTYRLCSDDRLATCDCANSRKWSESIVGENIDALLFHQHTARSAVPTKDAYSVICLEIIDIFSKCQRPKVFAEEFYHV